MLISRRIPPIPLTTASKALILASNLQCRRPFSLTSSWHEQRIPPSPPSALEGAPRAYGKDVKEFTPKPLDRPIGLPDPPKVSANSNEDKRTWREKWNDYVDRDKHLAKRRKLVRQFVSPYFREWTNMRHHQGKSFICPPSLFRADKALFFPNFSGQTLLKTKKFQDTTAVLTRKVSVVSVYSSQWGESQAQSIIGQKNNPGLHEIVEENADIAQFVEINVEENAVKAFIVGLFLGGLRRRVGEKYWGRYFMVNRSPEMEVRDAIGLLNTKVGYTYLIDGDYKIRWACSGNAGEEEKSGIIRGTRRLIEEARGIASRQAESSKSKAIKAATTAA